MRAVVLLFVGFFDVIDACFLMSGSSVVCLLCVVIVVVIVSCCFMHFCMFLMIKMCVSSFCFLRFACRVIACVLRVCGC